MTAAPTTTSSTDSDESVLACTVLAVILRVAGPVPTEVRGHALGTPERQVCARVGDALLYFRDRVAAARVRQHWDAAQYLVSVRLPDRVSQTWLAPQPGAHPLGVCLTVTRDVDTETRFITGRRETRTPPHVRVRVDRLVFQVCDRQSWRTIGDALFDAQRHLDHEQ